MRRVSPSWLVVFVLAWWILATPRADAWVAGGLAVALGGLLHLALGGRGDGGLRPAGLVRFIPYFLGQSLRGGLDVGRRAISPSLPLAPDFLRYRVSLPDGPSRIFFLNAISLLPGTLSAEIQGRDLTVHRLAADVAREERLRLLEEKVAALFGVALDDRRGP